MDRKDYEKLLKRIFGLDRFYDTQWEVIEKILAGKRVLLIEKTGYGKSLCFQFPATQLEGMTIIFSPLIALMRDQVKKLQSLGISSAYINSGQTDEENDEVIARAKKNEIKLLYIAPERLDNKYWIDAIKHMKISFIVIDEAHCISVWGHDFRPAFRRIIDLVKLQPDSVPILATTATATKRVEDDIKEQLGINKLTSIRGNLLRKSLSLSVIECKSMDEKMMWLGNNINKLQGSGLIYTGTVVDSVIYSEWLNYLGIPTTYYNGRLDSLSRQEIEKGLIENKWKCIVSTSALGMGMDKPDIRFIIHTQIPQSPIHYYQEIGRAGRDEKNSDIILLWDEERDKDLPMSFIEGSKPAIPKYYKVIDMLKNSSMGEQQIIKQSNLKQTPIRVILADLIEHKIIYRNNIDRKYEYLPNAPILNPKIFDELRGNKLLDLDKMIEYTTIKGCRMNYLCGFLGDEHHDNCGKCDICAPDVTLTEIDDTYRDKLNSFLNNYFPALGISSVGTNLVDGYASGYYGLSDVGTIIHRSKYKNGGDFPMTLIKRTAIAFKTFGDIHVDMILFVPPTESGDLVKNFAENLSKELQIPVGYGLVKTRVTEPQKVFQNGYGKNDNVKNAFNYNGDIEKIKGKSILLVDDIFDSGHTIKEIGKLLTNLGVTKIYPLVIAKTIGGDFNQ